MIFHLTKKSNNKKIGKIPAVTISNDSCPDACPLKKNGCYAEGGPLFMHWRKVSGGERGGTLAELLSEIEKFSEDQVWRYAVAGDLPGLADNIDGESLSALVNANKGKRGFTYTHKPPEGKNAENIQAANNGGFTVNLSGNNVAHADELLAKKIGPVVTIIPHGEEVWKKTYTPAGNRVVQCPAEYTDVKCETCGNGRPLCQRADRNFIVGFTTHGVSKRKAASVASLPVVS